MNITFVKPDMPTKGVVVAFVLEGKKLATSAAALDKASGGAVSRAIKASRFEGKKGQSLSLFAPASTELDRILLIGLGKPEEVDEKGLHAAGGTIYAQLSPIAGKHDVMVDAIDKAQVGVEDAAALIASGALLRSYRFDKYRTKEKKEDKPQIKGLTVRVTNAAKAKRAFAELEAVANGVFLTRDLVSEPANVLYPKEFAKRIKDRLTPLGVKVTVLGEKEMQKLGMGSLLSVGDGSTKESQLVVMEWNGTRAKASKPISFIGKGVCFDTGGISLKPAANMEDMKWDMGGAGVVTGLMAALAGRKAKVHAIGVVGLVENMPDGNATRPGDIVKSMSGQTIEVLNTDAEGRLVLCDVLHYVNTKYKPKFMVDLATLTGAIIISLGHERAGLFANDDDLAEAIYKAGEATGERLWRMPLGEEYDKDINTDAADMKNIGSGRGAGSTIAAQFLKRFVGDTPWAHLDIAGVTWSKKDDAIVPKGGTAFGVRVLDRFVRDSQEGK